MGLDLALAWSSSSCGSWREEYAPLTMAVGNRHPLTLGSSNRSAGRSGNPVGTQGWDTGLRHRLNLGISTNSLPSLKAHMCGTARVGGSERRGSAPQKRYPLVWLPYSSLRKT